MTKPTFEPLALLGDLMAMAKAAGAQSADAVIFQNTALSCAWRLGKREQIDRSESIDIGLRAFVGDRQAVVSTSDPAPDALRAVAMRAVEMARVVPEDPHGGLADATADAPDAAPLDMEGDAEPSEAALESRAAAAEDAARAVSGISNSEGAEASWGRTRVALATSNGFSAAYTTSRSSLSVSVIAGTGTGMERDYASTSAVHTADLEAPEALGARAAEQAVRRLDPRKLATAEMPLIYEPRVSRGLLMSLAGAINGAAIARGTSFLRDSMGKRIFTSGITVTDDPLRPRGLRSKPFDGEGVAGTPLDVITDGVLSHWLLDSRAARQLGLQGNGRASRGTAGPPSPTATNLYMHPGTESPESMIGSIKRGLLVTELIGMGVNGVTGDYSRGAAGFLIEDGKIAYPVSEITVAGNLRDMFASLTPANDLSFHYGVDAPTIRIDGMTVAGA
jgi:PmbA protein